MRTWWPRCHSALWQPRRKVAISDIQIIVYMAYVTHGHDINSEKKKEDIASSLYAEGATEGGWHTTQNSLASKSPIPITQSMKAVFLQQWVMWKHKPHHEFFSLWLVNLLSLWTETSHHDFILCISFEHFMSRQSWIQSWPTYPIHPLWIVRMCVRN